jgi:NAD(P)-dependent dehydrogenase (short-subunit alcohol dehydrogenase family)
MQEIRDRVAVVTGAASGIGLALAERLADEGARLMLADVETEALAAAVARLEQRGAEVRGQRTDVSSAESVEALAEATLDQLGPTELLFANAGVIQAMGPLWERPIEDYEWVLGVNLWGPIHCVRSFVPRMLEAGRPAHVVITASMSGLSVVPGNGPYQISKHGAVALAETLRLELEDGPIGVSCLCPGFVRTGILQAERNRPERLRRDDAPPERPIAGGWTGAPTDALQAIARSPREVAERVIAALREDRFWILTHDDAEARLRSRFQALLEGRNPELDPSAPGGGPADDGA